MLSSDRSRPRPTSRLDLSDQRAAACKISAIPLVTTTGMQKRAMRIAKNSVACRAFISLVREREAAPLSLRVRLNIAIGSQPFYADGVVCGVGHILESQRSIDLLDAGPRYSTA